MAGKGDWRRPGDRKAFAENYERIFGKIRAVTTKRPAPRSFVNTDIAENRARQDWIESQCSDS